MSSITGTGISPGLARAGKATKEAMPRILPTLSDSIVRDFKAFLESRTGRQDTVNFRAFLVESFFLSGFLQGILSIEKRPVFAYGIEILEWDPKNRDGISLPLPPELAAVRVSRELNDRILEAEGVAPAVLLESASRMLEMEILPPAANYFLYIPETTNIIDIRARIENICRHTMETELRAGQPVTLTHFHFQDMRHYFEMSGERRTFEILEEIMRIIRENLKKNDSLLQISPHSYLVMSPGSAIEQIKERFHSIYFYIKSLVLEYELSLMTVDSLPIQWNEIWKKLGL